MKVEVEKSFCVVVKLESREEAKAVERALWLIEGSTPACGAFEQNCKENELDPFEAKRVVHNLAALLRDDVWSKG